MRPDRLTAEAGTTLVEVLVAVAIMGLAFVAVLGGMGTSIVASDMHRDQADANTVVISAAEAVKSHDTGYLDCATPAAYLGAARSVSPLPSGWTAETSSVTEVRYWSGTAFTSTCIGTGPQLVTLSASSPSGRATEFVSVAKGPFTP